MEKEEKEIALNNIIKKSLSVFEVYADVFITSLVEASILSALTYILSINLEIDYLTEDKVLQFVVFSYFVIAFFKYVKYLVFKQKEIKTEQQKNLGKEASNGE